MNIIVKRTTFTNKSTIGELSVDGIFQCYTLEDTYRGLNSAMDLGTIKTIKVAGKTAIPIGGYKVIINMSNHFKKLLPLLIDVPGYEGVRIHSGNTDADTEGCILVGTTKSVDEIGSSKIAFTALFDKIKNQTNLTIDIS